MSEKSTVLGTAARDERDIRELIQRWAGAVREHNYEAILADRDPDIVMFDVPPPFCSRGINEYQQTWDLFFNNYHRQSDAFDVRELEVTAGRDVAFAVATMRCGPNEKGRGDQSDFRLTIGLRKIEDRWRVVHEHHSVPAA